MATHLEFRYGQLRSEFNEQMGHANAIMVHAGADANAHINQLRLELENAEMNAKQKALAVGYANDRTCSLHVEMLDVTNQNQSMKSAMSLSIRRLETELDAADLKRDEIMREFRSDLRSEHNRYIVCEHHLALEESQLRLQTVRNEGLQSQLVTSEGRLSEESSSSEQSGMRDMRIMGLRSELHMKQSHIRSHATTITDWIEESISRTFLSTSSKSISYSASPTHGVYYEMYERPQHDHDELRKSTKELEGMYAEVRAELGDNESFIKTYQKSHDELGRKYEDALLKIDKINVNPNLSGTILDKLHNDIIDRDEVVNRLLTEVDAQRETIDRAHQQAGRAIGQINDRRLVIKGATDYSIEGASALVPPTPFYGGGQGDKQFAING